MLVVVVGSLGVVVGTSLVVVSPVMALVAVAVD